VGAGTSALEISRDIGPGVKKLYVSIREHKRVKYEEQRFGRLYPGAEVLPEIAEFLPLDSLTDGIQNGRILLKNGTILTGIDEVRNKNFRHFLNVVARLSVLNKQSML